MLEYSWLMAANRAAARLLIVDGDIRDSSSIFLDFTSFNAFKWTHRLA